MSILLSALNLSQQYLYIASSKSLPPKNGIVVVSKTVNKLYVNFDKTKEVFECPASTKRMYLIIVGSIVADFPSFLLIKYSLYFLYPKYKVMALLSFTICTSFLISALLII